jgi:hypothetical protein
VALVQNHAIRTVILVSWYVISCLSFSLALADEFNTLLLSSLTHLGPTVAVAVVSTVTSPHAHMHTLPHLRHAPDFTIAVTIIVAIVTIAIAVTVIIASPRTCPFSLRVPSLLYAMAGIDVFIPIASLHAHPCPPGSAPHSSHTCIIDRLIVYIIYYILMQAKQVSPYGTLIEHTCIQRDPYP